MKKAGRITLLVAGILYVIISLVFIVIEGRNFFSFDWQLYSHPFAGAFQSLARLLAALLYLASGLLAILAFSPKKEHPILMIYVDVFAVATFLIGMAVSTFLKEMSGPTPLYLTLPISLTSDLFAVGTALIYISDTRYKKNDSAPKENEK